MKSPLERDEVTTSRQRRDQFSIRELFVALTAIGAISAVSSAAAARIVNNSAWPYEWMLASFITAGSALVLPWLFSIVSRRIVAIISCLVMIVMFLAYELVLHNDLEPGTVLFQLELVVLLPLIVLALLSCGIAVYTGKRP